jgi:phospholipase/lecithinase/hemolysin
MKRLHMVSALGLIALWSYALPTFAAYTQVIAFGDSLSDNGNVYSASGGFFPPFPYWEGRFSNGEVAVEYLASELGVSLTDYAYGGATSGTNNYVSIAYPYPILSGLPGVSQEVSGYTSSLGGGTADSQALFILWAGANDFFTYEYDQSYYPGGPDELISSTVANIEDNLVALENAGARTILVPNLPEVLQGSNLAEPYAQALEAMLTTLEGTPGFDAKLVRLDVLGIYNAVLVDPAAFGFTNLSPCLNGISLCSFDIDVQNETPFWDESGHPTTAAHAILGNAMALAAVPISPSVWLFGSGLLGLIGMARHNKAA